jgi:hypothetical protein
MKEPTQPAPESSSETSPLVKGLGMGALVAGVGAAGQAVWDHTHHYRERLKKARDVKYDTESFFWWDEHHTPEWKALIIDPIRQQSGASSDVQRELAEYGHELAVKEINTITNTRIAMVVGTAVAAVVFGGLVYAHARHQQEASPTAPSPQITPQGLHHSPLKEQPLVPERT